VKWDAANRAPGLERTHLGDDPSLAKVGHQQVEAAKLQIPPKDGPDPFGFLLHHNDLAVLGRVCACSLVSSLLLSGATMSQQSSLTQSAHSVRQVLTAYMGHHAPAIGAVIDSGNRGKNVF